jgi:hypothetical protein
VHAVAATGKREVGCGGTALRRMGHARGDGIVGSRAQDGGMRGGGVKRPGVG